MPAMHDKPTDETKTGPDPSTQPADGNPAGSAGMADLPDRVAELSAADPADAPNVADEIAAVLEQSLDSASPSAAEGRNPRSGTGDR